MEPREDSVLPQAVSMTILLSVLAFLLLVMWPN